MYDCDGPPVYAYMRQCEFNVCAYMQAVCRAEHMNMVNAQSCAYRMSVAGSAAEVWARERERVGPDRRVMGAMSHQRAISAGEAHIHPTVTK